MSLIRSLGVIVISSVAVAACAPPTVAPAGVTPATPSGPLAAPAAAAATTAPPRTAAFATLSPRAPAAPTVTAPATSDPRAIELALQPGVQLDESQVRPAVEHALAQHPDTRLVSVAVPAGRIVLTFDRVPSDALRRDIASVFGPVAVLVGPQKSAPAQPGPAQPGPAQPPVSVLPPPHGVPSPTAEAPPTVTTPAASDPRAIELALQPGVQLDESQVRPAVENALAQHPDTRLVSVAVPAGRIVLTFDRVPSDALRRDIASVFGSFAVLVGPQPTLTSTPTPTPTRTALSPAEREAAALAAAQKVLPSVVAVRSSSDPTDRGRSGFIISADGYILTNAHVVEGASVREVVLYDGRRVSGRVVGRVQSQHPDVGVIKIEATGLHAVEFGDPSAVQIGDPLLAVGHPNDIGYWIVTGGELEGTQLRPLLSPPDPVGFRDLKSTVPSAVGNSGGPVVNLRGQVVALLWGAFSRSEPEIRPVPLQVIRSWAEFRNVQAQEIVTAATSIDDARKFAQQIIEKQGDVAGLPAPSRAATPAFASSEQSDDDAALTAARKVLPSVVAVGTGGAGFVISSDGYILTNAHVVEGITAPEVVLYDGRRFGARIVGRVQSRQPDVAVLRIEASGLSPAVFGEPSTVAVGETLLAVGHPGGVGHWVVSGGKLLRTTSGNVPGTLQVAYRNMVLDTPGGPGNSGGPIVNLKGEVVGQAWGEGRDESVPAIAPGPLRVIWTWPEFNALRRAGEMQATFISDARRYADQIVAKQGDLP